MFVLIRTTAKSLKHLRHFLGYQRNFSTPSYFHRPGSESLIYRTLGQQLELASEKFGHHPALISRYEGKQLTFAEAHSQAEVLAVKLKQLGLQRGDHLAIWATNSTQWYLTFLAAGLAGFPLVCMNPAWQGPEAAYALRKAKVVALLTEDECGKQNFKAILRQLLTGHSRVKNSNLCENLPKLRAIIMRSASDVAEFHNYQDLLDTPAVRHEIDEIRMHMEQVSAEAPMNIQFTSGTTGQPKAALLSHFNVVNQGAYFGPILDIHKQHRNICLPLPFFHAFGLSVTASALSYGATLVLPSPTFDASAALETIEKENCKVVLGTPTMFVDLIEAQRHSKRQMDSLEIAITGGAACSPQLYNQVKTVFGLRSMRIVYGLSETTSAIFATEGDDNDSKQDQSVGKIFAYGEAKIINDKGETVAFGETGELCVRGFFNMLGYFEDEQKTSEVLSRDGWLKTGDEFMIHSDGTGFVMGRKKDVVIRGGENIFPKEIEDFLDTHESVLETQIIGVPDERMGEEICAYLRLRPGAKQLTAADIKSFCHGKLAHFKVPRYVRIVQEFPKTNSGKIQKFKLRQMFQNENEMNKN